MAPIRFLFLIFIVGSLTGCVSSVPRFSSSYPADDIGGEGADEPDASSNDIPPSVDTKKLMRTIGEYLSVPYTHGGASDEGIDCSAFTRSVFEKVFAITLPRSTEDQYRMGKKIRKRDLAPGDLVFFNTTGRVPSHVGIYVGDGLFAHASINEGVTISSLSTPYYRQRYNGARRVIK